jgi:Flp pilus assembly protein TadG
MALSRPNRPRSSLLRRFMIDRRGAIAVMSAFLLPIMIATIGLVYEFGNGLLVKAQNQRIADAAAYAGALAYNDSSSTTSMTQAAQAVAALNGIPATNVSANLVTSPSGDGNSAVEVGISSTDMLILAPVLSVSTHSSLSNTLSISSSSFAELKSQAAGCIMALSSKGTGVTLSGGTSVTANSCDVSSNATVTVPCGTTITAQKVSFDSSTAPSQGCSGIKGPNGTAAQIVKQAVTDPLASNTEVTGSTAVLTNVAKTSNPTASGTAVSFTSFMSSPPSLPSGCSINSGTGSPWTVTCNSGGTYNFGEISVGGGTTVTFVNSGTSVNTYNIGSGSCSGTYSICDTGTALTFLGPSNFNMSGGISVGGGSTVTLAAKTTSGAPIDNDSFNIGSASGSDAINMLGTSLVFGNAEGSGDTFTVNGTITSGGGSCLWLPAAAEHEINGDLLGGGGISLADDPTENNVYTITGYAWFGANGGGDVTCNGQSIGVLGENVTLILGGTSIPTSGTCGGYAFCVGAGYNEVDLTAPTTGSTADLAVVGPSSVAAGALFTEGSSGSDITGAFYFPDGPIVLNGAGSVNSAGCLEIIGTQITLSGGSTAASACTGLSSSSGSTVTLVQ